MFTRIVVPALVLVALMITGCKTAPKSTDEKADLRQQAQALLSTAQQQSPVVKDFVAKSEAYAVFPSIGEGGFLVAGGYGKGVFYEHGKIAGYCDASQLSIGATIGGQSFSELIFFENEFASTQFKSGSYSLDAKVSAVALDAAAGKAAYTKGIAVVVLDRNGLMAQASVGGQKFRYQPAPK